MDDSTGAFTAFQRLVTNDPAMIGRLRPILDVEPFIAAVVAEGAVHGLHFEADDVTAVLRANRHGWLTSWLPVI